MSTLDTVQQEQLRAIGTYLSQIRQEQERSLEDIAAKTYIPLRLLKAIEAGQEKPLPEPVFIQGFIRRYGDALGLDGIDLSQKFPVHVTPLPIATTVAPSRESRLSSASESTYVHNAPSEDDLPRQPRALNRNGLLPYVAAAALLAFGGIALGIVRAISSRQPEGPTRSAVVLPEQPSVSASPESPAPSPTASPTAQAPKQSPKAAPSSTVTSNSTASPKAPTSSSSSASATNSNAPVSVTLSLTDESWVQVVVDGAVKAEAVLPKGTQQSWSGQREIIVLAGNAGAVSVSHNGGTAQKMGALGDVSEKTFTPKPSGASNSSPN